MEWNWKMKHNGMIDVTPYLLYESSADSDDAITKVHHHHNHNHQEEQMQEKGQEQEDMDDDAESSCTCDHLFHVNVKTHDNHHKTHGYEDGHHHHSHCHGDDDGGGGGEEDIHDDDDDRNWGESKMIGQEQRSCHELCFDSSNLDDRQFWETCLAS